MWKKPWGYKEGFICGAGLCVTGLLLQWTIGGVCWQLFAWPVNFIVLILYLCLLAVMHALRKRVSPIVRMGGRSNEIHIATIKLKNTPKPKKVETYTTPGRLPRHADQAPSPQSSKAETANGAKLFQLIRTPPFLLCSIISFRSGQILPLFQTSLPDSLYYRPSFLFLLEHLQTGIQLLSSS